MINQDKLKQYCDNHHVKKYLSRGFATPFEGCGLTVVEVCRTGVVFRIDDEWELTFLPKNDDFEVKLRDLMFKHGQSNRYLVEFLHAVFCEDRYTEEYLDHDSLWSVVVDAVDKADQAGEQVFKT